MHKRIPHLRSVPLPLVALALLLVAGHAWADEAEPAAGTVQTAQSRQSGDLQFDDDAVRVGSARLTWDRLLTMSFDAPRQTLASPHVVHLVGGEQWPGRVLALDEQELTIDVPALGERVLPRDALTAIDFVQDLPWPPERYGVLERREGGPVPSTLLRIGEQTLAVDSPLGELEVRRDLARRYIFEQRESPDADAGQDELTLVGGAVLHGTVRPSAAGVALEHRWLGELELEWGLVTALRRRTPAVVYLADLEPTAQEAEPLLVESLPIDVFVERIDRAGALDAWSLQPKLRQVYALPDAVTAEGGAIWLRAQVAPMRGARGPVTLRVFGDDAEAWSGEIAPDAEAEVLNIELGAVREVALELDYGEPMAFPLGVELIDPLLLTGADE
ncbi:MAG: hypothetical protein WD534_07950 [Phycisphaeraceae bacterium]